MLIISLFCIFNNLLYKLDYDNDGNYKYEETTNNDALELHTELKKYNVNNPNDKNIYLTLKTKLDCINNQNKYPKNTWQYLKYNDYLYSYLYNINYYKYINKNKNLLNESLNQYQQELKYFKKNNWRHFVTQEKKELSNQLLEITKTIESEFDKQTKLELEKERQTIENKLLIIQYRLEKNIDYGNNYLNRALTDFENKQQELKQQKNNSYQEKISHNELIKEIELDKYIINKKINIKKENNLNYQLRDIIDDYELFIVIIILLASSILIGEEFNKGTIKLLLIKPFNRFEILLSKYLTAIIIMLLTIIFIALIQLIIGGIFFGFDSLSNPVPIYNFNINKVVEYNIISYMLIRIIIRIPMFIMLITISILVSNIINNTIGSFSLIMLLYMFSLVINNIIIEYNLKLFQYFLTMNWDFKQYLFGSLSNFSYLNLKKSILIYIIYVIIFLSIMFINFKKKNIKNI